MPKRLGSPWILVALWIVGSPLGGVETKRHPVIWHDPGIVETLDFVGGPGGRSQAPRPPFRFLKEDASGSNPKIQVRDRNGQEWRVKWGSEVHAEVFASRLAWAAGYFVEPTYYVARGKINGVSRLRRAKKYVAADGSFTDARFEVAGKGLKYLKQQSWAWTKNPFVGGKELHGLEIIMILTSNWDNKDVRDAGRGTNTGVLERRMNGGVEWRYAVTDWGASMGKWGGVMGREKWDCEGFTSQTTHFITGVQDGLVQWGYHGQHTNDFVGGIRVADVKWLLHYVGRITEHQMRAGLAASGATPEEVACFTAALQARIQQMKDLPGR
jgi:hypothetical protein